jgi:hypothetical protein
MNLKFCILDQFITIRAKICILLYINLINK